MLNSAFLYSFQSNKETENQMFKIGLGRIGCLLVYLHALAVEQQFLDAAHHIGEHAADDTEGVGGVVAAHVFRQLVEVVGLIAHRAGKPFACIHTVLLLVLVNLVTNHNR